VSALHCLTMIYFWAVSRQLQCICQVIPLVEPWQLLRLLCECRRRPVLSLLYDIGKCLPSELCIPLVQQLITTIRCLPCERRTTLTARLVTVLEKRMEAAVLVPRRPVRSTRSCTYISTGMPSHTLPLTLFSELGPRTRRFRVLARVS
jgi:hypothetical protein